MKTMKKVLAMIVTLAMVLAMPMTAFASDEGEPAPAGKPNSSNTALAKVFNVEDGATVTAYQIVKADYNDNGFLGYVRANGITEDLLADVVKPTSSEITTIAANKTLLDSLIKETMTKGAASEKGFEYTAQLTPGYWVVVVTGSNRQVVYNPMLVGVYYSIGGSNDTLTPGSVDATTNWSLESTPAYAKSNTPEFDKKITGSTAENGADNTDTTLEEQANNKGNDVAIGDTVHYQIDATIPSYSESYTRVKVEITDKLSTGLRLEGTPVVTVGSETAVAGTDYTYTEGTPENGFTIAFISDYALAHSGEAVVVTYDAVLTEDAATNFDPNTNTATFEYSNDPQDENNTEKTEKKTYTYTFEIDGNLYGNNEGEWNKVTEELLKGKKVTTTETGKWKDFGPLAGAEFKLTNKTTNKEYTATSTADGRMNFKGLDAGTYELVETKAPEGFTLNNTKVPVVITAEYNDDGTLKNYNITVDGKNSSTYNATYDKSDESTAKDVVTEITVTEKIETKPGYDTSDAYIFWNTELSTLPSTGGIGTTIFTIGGCIIMIAAAALFFASRRKKAEN